VGGTDQALVVFPHRRQQQPLALRIQLRQHIIQQQQGWGTHHLPHQIQFRQFQGQHQGALLAGRTMAAGSLVPQKQFDFIAVGTDETLPQAGFLRALVLELAQQGQPPWFLGIQLQDPWLHAGAAAVVAGQGFLLAPQPPLPPHRQGFEAPQGPLPAAMQARAHNGHLLVEDIEQRLLLGQGERRRSSWLRCRSRRP